MHCEVTVLIPAPADVVWQAAQAPNLRHKWDVRVARYEVLGAQAPGGEIRLTLRLGWLRPVVRGRFLRWAPPQQSVVQIDQGRSSLTPAGAGSWTFKAVGEGQTELTSRFTLRTETLPWWMPAWLYAKAVEWDTRRSFRRLRQLIIRKGMTTP